MKLVISWFWINIGFVLFAFGTKSVAAMTNDVDGSNEAVDGSISNELESFTNVARKKCTDTLSQKKCNFWKRYGACYQFASRLTKWCMKTCGFCDVDQCENVSCPPPKSCTIDYLGRPLCTCPKYCKNRIIKQGLGNVCGTDGKVYPNRCDMEVAACEQDKYITVQNYGECKSAGCRDVYPGKTCTQWSKRGSCQFWRQYMMKYCSLTCGICALSYSECASSKYGCCMDMRTTAIGPQGGGCPRCKNKFPMCNSFEEDCNSSNTNNRRFMKEYCSKTCGYC